MLIDTRLVGVDKAAGARDRGLRKAAVFRQHVQGDIVVTPTLRSWESVDETVVSSNLKVFLERQNLRTMPEPVPPIHLGNVSAGFLNRQACL